MVDEKATDPPSDISNRFLVGASGDGKRIIIQKFQRSISADDAINLAAWLAVLAGDETGRQTLELIETIRGT